MPILRPRVRGGDPSTRIRLAAASDDKQGPISAITKWVPIEVIAFYEGITTPFGNDLHKVLIWAIIVGVVVTILWTAFATESAQSSSRIAWRQVVLGSIAFLFWAVGTVSPDIWKILYPWWHPAICPAVLATGAILIPIANGILKKLGVPQD